MFPVRPKVRGSAKFNEPGNASYLPSPILTAPAVIQLHPSMPKDWSPKPLGTIHVPDEGADVIAQAELGDVEGQGFAQHLIIVLQLPIGIWSVDFIPRHYAFPTGYVTHDDFYGSKDQETVNANG